MKGAWLYNVRAAIWGGNFNNGAIAGVFYLNLNNERTNSNNNRGFRAASVLQARSGKLTGLSPERKNKGIHLLADSLF